MMNRRFWKEHELLRLKQWPRRLHVFALLILSGTASVTAAPSGLSGQGTHETGFADVRFGLKAGLNFAQHVGTEERHVDYTYCWKTD